MSFVRNPRCGSLLQRDSAAPVEGVEEREEVRQIDDLVRVHVRAQALRVVEAVEEREEVVQINLRV